MKDIEFSISGPMICGQYEAEIRRYKKLKGKKTTWYVSTDINAADNVYACPDEEQNRPGYGGFRGFGGATLSFELEDGIIDQVTGPWHSNSHSLYADTGYDIRDKNITQGIIAKNRVGKDFYNSVYSDILHYDEIAVIGLFNRIEDMAQEFADKLDREVYYAVKSNGGGSSGTKKPIKNL